MKFNRTRPCSGCLFRVDTMGYLHPERAQEFITDLLEDDAAWFGCHKTTEPIENDDGMVERVCSDKTNVCTGSLILLNHLGQLPVVARIAVATGLLNLDQLDDQRTPVVATAEQFIEHHTKAWI